MNFDLQEFYQCLAWAERATPLMPTRVTSPTDVYGLRHISLQRCGYWPEDVQGRYKSQAHIGCGAPFLFSRHQAMMGEVPCWRYNGHLVSYDFDRDGNYFEALEFLEFRLNLGLKIEDYGIEEFLQEYTEEVDVVCPCCEARRSQHVMRGTRTDVQPLSEDTPWDLYFRSYSTGWLLDAPI